MFMLALRYMFIVILTNRLTNNSSNMFNSNPVNMLTSASANMFISDFANMFTSDLADMFTSQLKKCKKNGLTNMFPSKVDWWICLVCTRNMTLGPKSFFTSCFSFLGAHFFLLATHYKQPESEIWVWLKHNFFLPTCPFGYSSIFDLLILKCFKIIQFDGLFIITLVRCFCFLHKINI